MVAAVAGDPLGLEREMAADVDEHRGPRPVALGLGLEVVEGHAEVVAVAVDEHTSPCARRMASGVAMNVFDGHSTVPPATPAKSSAASAPPAQPENATAGAPFHADHAASNRCGHLALRPLLGVDDLVPQGMQPRRSRGSKPIANFEKSERTSRIVSTLPAGSVDRDCTIPVSGSQVQALSPRDYRGVAAASQASTLVVAACVWSLSDGVPSALIGRPSQVRRYSPSGRAACACASVPIEAAIRYQRG